jgi:hypothetical protein
MEIPGHVSVEINTRAKNSLANCHSAVFEFDWLPEFGFP